MTNIAKIFCILLCLMFACCGSKGNREKERVPLLNRNEVQKQTFQSISIEKVDTESVYKDIKKFRSILQTKKKLSEADWRLHDSLLNTYKRLKYRPSNDVLTIPAKTNIAIPLKSYCLDSGKADPVPKELFQWKKADHRFIYLRSLLKLSSQKKYPQTVLQNLIWNLKNETPWEGYPDSEQEILKSIDPQAPVKLPSDLKSKIKSKVLDKIEEQAPGATKEFLQVIEGRYNEYETFKRSIESRSSQEELPEGDFVLPVEGEDLYTANTSESFADQQVTFYNISEQNQTIDLSEYYQKPLRSDIQSLAAYFALDPYSQLYKDLEKLLFEDMTRLGLGASPVLGDLIDLYEASTGKNFFTDEWLTDEERFMSAMAVLAGSGQAYRYADKILNGPPSYISDVQTKYRQIKDSESYKSLERLSKEAYGKGIPDDWAVKVTRVKKNGAQGIEYIHPENEHTKIRVMPGNPAAKHKSMQEPYVKMKKNGKSLDKNGNDVEDRDERSHIPLSEFDFSMLLGAKK